MQPTTKLRIVLRRVPSEYGSSFTKLEKVHQQWWENSEPDDWLDHDRGEWRDIPIEVEE